MLIRHDGHLPEVDPTAWVHDSAHVIGRAAIGPESSVWFGCVVRADIHNIRIGRRTNLQDMTVVHVTRDRFPTILGDEVTVGHRAVVHGCSVGDRCLIGIGAIVLDGVEIGSESMVAAGALVAPGTRVPSGVVVMGQPARIVRDIRPQELELIERTARHYAEYAANYRRQGI
jgi:carbonic anhydrase/acetyltransferase-like protein (isoleucine patch superfamily)